MKYPFVPLVQDVIDDALGVSDEVVICTAGLREEDHRTCAVDD